MKLLLICLGTLKNIGDFLEPWSHLFTQECRCVYMHLDCRYIWYDISCLLEHFAPGMSETEKVCEEIAATPARQKMQTAIFKYQISLERGHHLKYESVWRMRGTMWGVRRAGWTDTLHFTTTLSPFSSRLSVNWITQRMGNQQRQRGRDGETLCNAWPSSTPAQVSKALVAMDTVNESL